MALKIATCYKQRTEIFLVTTPPTWFLFLVSKKGQNRDKSEFVTKYVVIMIRIIFM